MTRTWCEIAGAAFLLGFSLWFFVSVVYALFTGALPLGKRITRRKDGAIGFYFCVVVAFIAAVLSLAVAAKLGLGWFGG